MIEKKLNKIVECLENGVPAAATTARPIAFQPSQTGGFGVPGNANDPHKMNNTTSAITESLNSTGPIQLAVPEQLLPEI